MTIALRIVSVLVLTGAFAGICYALYKVEKLKRELVEAIKARGSFTVKIGGK